MKFFTIIFILTLGINIFAAPGDLDPTFGMVGFKIAQNIDGLDRSHEIIRQPDGKILLVGNRNEESGSAITLMRFNADGSLDTTFDGDGIVLGENGQANAAVLQTDGKIVVTGKTANLQGTFFTVLRFNADGSPDASFANNGKFIDNSLITGKAVAIQTDGKIVVAGTEITVGSNDFAVVRLNSNGTFDTTFDGDSKVRTAVGDPQINSGDDVVTSLALQTDGKILVGGYSLFAATARDFSIVRYNPNGSLDSSFDGDGILHTPFADAAQDESLESLAIDADGKIVAVGYAVTNSGEESFALARYNADGSPDVSFDGDGKKVFKIRPNTFERLTDVEILADGKILAVGSSGYSTVDFAVLRFKADGSLDTSFGLGGYVFTRTSEQFDSFLESAAIAPNGDIFGGGYAETAPGRTSFAFAKYNSEGIPAAEFGTFGYVTTRFSDDPAQSYLATSTKIQTDGKILVGGNSFAGETFQGIVARYETNGSLDRSFGNQSGFINFNISGTNFNILSRIALQPDGKILAVGTYIGDADLGIYLYRLNSNGTFDTTFGSDGLVRIGVLDGGAIGTDVYVLPNGKILIAGGTANLFTQVIKPAVFRLNANGSRDTTFGSNGFVSVSFGSTDDVASALDVQADGKIVISGAGEIDLGGSRNVSLARFNANGTIDNSFGTSGKVTTDVGSFVQSADVKLQTDGKIVIGGVICTDNNCDNGRGYISRYNPNGSLDSSFNGNGQIRLSGDSNAVTSIAIQPDGKILAGGFIVNSAGNSDALLVRYNSDGSPDTAFGMNGLVTSDIGNTQQISTSIALQTDGKIVSAGSSGTDSGTDFAVWRYLGNSENNVPANKAPFDFDGDGKTDYAVFRPSSGVWYLQNSTSGFSASQFGLSNDRLAPADYDGDGKTDIAVFRGGTWYLLQSKDGFKQTQFGQAGDVPVPADFDGDGKADLAVYRDGANGSQSVFYYLGTSNNPNKNTTFIPFGSGGDKPVVGDYDGDGKSDPGVYRSGVWYLLRSQAGATAVQFGIATDKATPADFDGDGKTDLAVYRKGVWYILNSSDGQAGIVQFGLENDKPTVGDYDGDGKADISVWRDSNGVFYVLRSQAGFTAVQFGTGGDVPIASAYVQQ